MSERNERVEALVRRWVLKHYREETANEHLRQCPDTRIEHYDAHNSVYGCDTGCDYWRVEAWMSCPHDQHEAWEAGDFGELDWFIEELEEMDAQEATEAEDDE